MPSKEICGFCWGADKARPSASDREGSNRISARLAIPFKRPSTFLLQASRLESFRKLHAACRILFLHSSDFRNEGNLEGVTLSNRRLHRSWRSDVEFFLSL